MQKCTTGLNGGKVYPFRHKVKQVKDIVHGVAIRLF